jgi:Bacterial capsule synthesis protein PGA_cap
MVSHQAVLELARQGDAEAIALLINQALITRGIQVRAVCKSTCLHVLLEAAQVPDRLTYSRAVYAAVFCLGATTIQTLQVYGRQQNVQLPAWTEVFRLTQQPAGEPKEPAEPGAKAPDAAGEGAALQPRGKRSSASPAEAPMGLALPLALSIMASFAAGAGFNYYNQHNQHNQPNQNSQPNPAQASSSSQASPIVSPTASPTETPAAPNPALAAFPPPLPSATPPAANSAPANSAPANSAPANSTPAVAVTLKAVGDMIPGSNYPTKALPTEAGDALAAEREMLFGNIKPFFDEADLLFGNFESTLTDFPYSAKDTSQNMTFAFRTPPVYAQMLKDLGFDVLSVANNHSMDFGEQGFADTITHIEQAGMKAVGKKGQIVYTTVNNIPIAFIGFSYLPDHNLMHDLDAAAALVQEAKQQAKIVVISVHAGAEGSDQVHTANRNEYFFGEDRGNLVQFAHTLVDQGADLILGHGPHVPRALELYQGKLIAYSLGNFVGYQTLSTVGTLGYSLILKAQMDGEGNFVGGRIIPVALDRNGIPKLDDFFQSVVLIRSLTRSDFPQTPLTIDDMGYILRVGS